MVRPSLPYITTTFRPSLPRDSFLWITEGLLCFIMESEISGQSFQLVRQAFLQADGLPLGDLLSEDDIQRAFNAEHADFARDEGDIYTPAVTLWAFLSQTLHAGRLRSWRRRCRG